MCSKKVITWFLLAFRRSCKKWFLFLRHFSQSLLISLYSNHFLLILSPECSELEEGVILRKNGSVEKTRNRSMVQNRSFFLFTLFECIGMTLNVQSKVIFNHKMTTRWPQSTFWFSNLGFSTLGTETIPRLHDPRNRLYDQWYHGFNVLT